MEYKWFKVKMENLCGDIINRWVRGSCEESAVVRAEKYHPTFRAIKVVDSAAYIDSMNSGSNAQYCDIVRPSCCETP